MKLLASNKHHDLPQQVYELGTVVRNHKNSTRLSFLSAERSGGFASLRGRIQAFCRDLGITDWHLEPLEAGDGPFLAGRGAKLLVRGTWVGCVGELDPHVSMSFDLRVPISGAIFENFKNHPNHPKNTPHHFYALIQGPLTHCRTQVHPCIGNFPMKS